MKSFKEQVESKPSKFERATKTDVHYTGTINGKTWVVPHSFHGSHDVLHGTKVTPIRHAIVVSPIHVQHNNPSLKPEEMARVHQHIKDIHGGQEGKAPKFDSMGKLEEDLKAEWNRDFSKNRRANIRRTMRQQMNPKAPGKGGKAWLRADREYRASRPRTVTAGLQENERQLALHLGMSKADRVQPSKEVPEVKKAETHYKKTHKPVKGTPEYQAERDKYRHAAMHASRKAATLAFAKKHHLLEIKNMLKENKYGFAPGFRPKAGRGDTATYHQTQVAKKTLRMPDAMLGVIGGMNKDEARKHLKSMNWTDAQIHKHEHDQFVSEHVWNVTDHLGHQHDVEAKDKEEAMKKTVSVDGVHPQGIPMTQWHKVRVERKNLEEKVLTPAEDAKKEDLVHSMKKKLQGFKERYGKDAKSVMYATATKQAKRLAEEVLKSSHGTADGHSHVVKSSYSKGKFSGTVRTSHRDNRYSYTGPEPVSPVEHEKPKKWSHDVAHGTTGSAIRKKNPHLDSTQAQAISRHFEEHKNKVRQLSEGVEQLEEAEQLDELKMPNTGWLGAHPREIAGRVHDMGHHELKSLHKSYEKNPPQSVVQKQQHRSIKKALRKYGDAQGTHNYVDKSKFVKKDLKEATKHSLEHIEDKTSILPHVVGRTVAEKRGLKGPEVEKFAQHVADRTVHLYNHNPTFKKNLHGSGDAGRDHLYMFANHWLDAKSHLKESKLVAPSAAYLKSKEKRKQHFANKGDIRVKESEQLGEAKVSQIEKYPFAFSKGARKDFALEKKKAADAKAHKELWNTPAMSDADFNKRYPLPSEKKKARMNWHEHGGKLFREEEHSATFNTVKRVLRGE